MTIKAKLSEQGKKKLKRIETLPEFGEKIVRGAVKKEIDNFILTYKKALDNNDIGLVPLQPSTVKSKTNQGFSKPTNPLYGAGDSEKNSLYNALAVRKLKNGYQIYIRRAKHWKSNLTIRQLFWIHNYGAKIQVGDTIIQIPPRPIFLLTYERLMKRIRGDKRLGNKVKRAIVEYVNNANTVYAQEYIRILEKRENEE